MIDYLLICIKWIFLFWGIIGHYYLHFNYYYYYCYCHLTNSVIIITFIINFDHNFRLILYLSGFGLKRYFIIFIHYYYLPYYWF